MEESTSEKKVLDWLSKLDGHYTKSNDDLQSDHEKSKHNCHHCGKQFSNRMNLKIHIESIHENLNSYKCQHT